VVLRKCAAVLFDVSEKRRGMCLVYCWEDVGRDGAGRMRKYRPGGVFLEALCTTATQETCEVIINKSENDRMNSLKEIAGCICHKTLV